MTFRGRGIFSALVQVILAECAFVFVYCASSFSFFETALHSPGSSRPSSNGSPTYRSRANDNALGVVTEGRS